MILSPKYPANLDLDPRMRYSASMITDNPINIGAGINPIRGATNQDMNPGPEIDLTFDLLKFPWPVEDGKYDRVYAFQVIEHIPVKYVIGFLAECKRIVKQGDAVVIECPDIEGLCKAYLDGNKGVLEAIYSRDRKPGDPHRWGYTRDGLSTLMYAVGYQKTVTLAGSDYHSLQIPVVRVEGVA